MIPVTRPKEPGEFDSSVRLPGKKWLRANPKAKRPRPYWDTALPKLRKAFGERCGYAAMLDPTGGTVDHYISYNSDSSLAYEWSNYRFASAIMNSSKKTADDSILDPYQVKKGWFKIILPSLQMIVTDKVPSPMRAKAEYTLERLKLRDGERIIRWRRAWYKMYQEKKLTLKGLRQIAPLIADAIEN